MHVFPSSKFSTGPFTHVYTKYCQISYTCTGILRKRESVYSYRIQSSTPIPVLHCHVPLNWVKTSQDNIKNTDVLNKRRLLSSCLQEFSKIFIVATIATINSQYLSYVLRCFSLEINNYMSLVKVINDVYVVYKLIIKFYTILYKHFRTLGNSGFGMFRRHKWSGYSGPFCKYTNRLDWIIS